MVVHSWGFACVALFQSWAAAPALPADGDAARPSLWVDVYQGEPVTYEALLDDLAASTVIYLGERHTVQRHHDLETKLVVDLGAKGLPLVVGLEQLDTSAQPALDKFNRQEIDFDKLAELTDWAKQWRNYQQYRPTIEAARKAGATVIALNAKSEVIRQIARGGGVEKLPADMRKELPADMQLQDPAYEKLLGLSLMVHMAATPERMRPMIEAQIARDETMAATLAAYLNSAAGRKRTAVVICGAGHVNYGLATAGRVHQRIPGVRDRIVIFSESGDVKLSPEEMKMAREVEITHEQLREINRPIADYLSVVSLAPDRAETKPAGP